MDPAHLHIILNHIPVIGSSAVIFVMAYGLIRKNEEIKKLGLILMVLVALTTIPVYVSGDGAENIVQGMDGVIEDAIEDHEDFAQYSFILMEVFGGICLLGLIIFRNPKVLPGWYLALCFFFLLTLAGMMAWTANLGGQIHHPEIAPGFKG